MVKIINVIGARPQIIKAAAISRAIKNNFSDKIQEIIVHTGQHYDNNMSTVFLEELGIPQPHYNLNVGSAGHAKQTSDMIVGMEEIILKEDPDFILVYGDTNSTLAAAVTASKMHYPIVHIEAGLRSFNKNMPEEINRIMCDHVSTFLFTPTVAGLTNLEKEGFKNDFTTKAHMNSPKVYHCGDIMYDNSLYFSLLSSEKYPIESISNLKENEYILSTIHRPSNTDNKENLLNILSGLEEIAKQSSKKVVIPLHPRTKNKLETYGMLDDFMNNEYIKIIPPSSFLEMTSLEKNAYMIATDSGGVQKEAFFFKKPCLILRDETEWIEIAESGNAILCGCDKDKIIDAYTHFATNNITDYPDVFGDGKAAEFILDKLITNH